MSNTREDAYAHSGPGAPGSNWHCLEDHLRSVSNLAGDNAEKWSARSVAAIAGLWHDLGKYAPDWQMFLREVGMDAPADDAEPEEGSTSRRRGPDHSTARAIHARAKLEKISPRIGQLVEFVIAGHHAGLSDWQDLKTRLDKPEKRRRYA